MAVNIIAHIAQERDPAFEQLEAYGIEVEVEEYPIAGAPRRQQLPLLAPFWEWEPDGSLRNNGLEFVSKKLVAESVVPAIGLLYATTAGFWSPSVRTGIHIHCNMLGRTFEEVRRICSYYAFAEPYLYSLVSPDREQNIYCVPWYRTPMEVDVAADALTPDNYRNLREACKYSGLYIGPLLTYGTIEFRHAQTFVSATELIGWWEACRTIAMSWSMPDPVRLYAEQGTQGVLRQLFGARLTDAEIARWAAAADELGATEAALRFRTYTYKLGEWGKPGEFVVNAAAQQEADRGRRPVIQEWWRLGPDRAAALERARADLIAGWNGRNAPRRVEPEIIDEEVEF